MTTFWKLFALCGRWLFLVFVLSAGFTRHGGGVWHQLFGYGALSIALLRIAAGLVGPQAARFPTTDRSPSATLVYIRSIIQRKTASHDDVSPLSGLTLISVLAAMVLTGMSGILLTLDGLWSVRWIVALHAVAAFALVFFMALHRIVPWAIRRGKRI